MIDFPRESNCLTNSFVRESLLADIDKPNGTALILSPLEMDSDVPEANSDYEQKTRTSLKISISTLALALNTVSPFAVARDGSYQWIRISNASGYHVKVKYYPNHDESGAETLICKSGKSCDIGQGEPKNLFGYADKVIVVKIKPMGDNAVA